MRKKKQPQQAAKPLWPGAGLSLDFGKITGQDFDDKVEPHLASIGDASSQIKFLSMLLAHLTHDSEQVRQEIRSRDYGMSIFGGDQALAEYGGRCRAFAERIQRKLALLKELARIEDEEQRRAAALQKKEKAPEVEDEPAGLEWNNETKAIALYVLFRMAGAPEDHKRHNKTETAKFAHLLTGRSPNKMADFYFSAATGAVSNAAVEVVAGQFEKMGLLELAMETRKFYKTGRGFQKGSN
jgi:hypothetical protein